MALKHGTLTGYERMYDSQFLEECIGLGEIFLV
jgi:hypothetical protein